ncbi:MAG: rhomboid family intramembrane serine protease [Alphaproteobacteria bacterium]|nr:rhomboid family intramembrane serine protease [Alphaproteobacteria bacterium]
MIPLHDENPLRHIRFQYVTVAIIALCVAVFLYQSTLPPKAERVFVMAWGAIPAAVFGLAERAGEIAAVPPSLTLVTSMFVHGGLMHLAGNMLFLWVLGDNIEDAMGHGRFVVFYLLAGLAAALTHAGLDPASQIPMVGASGAISGVIGAYLILHPKAPIKTLVLRMIVYMPAWMVLGLWFGFQLLNVAMTPKGSGGVAWWAHIGGFVAGVVLIFLFRKRDTVLFDRGYVPRPRKRSIIPDSERS